MNLLIIGPQASGKGTQAELLSEKFNLVHFEMGEILRDIAKEDSERGKWFASLNERKEMFPDNVILEILEEKIVKIPEGKGIIFDGVPRTEAQIQPVQDLLHKLDRKIDKAIYITLPREESIARISRRYSCEQCKNKLVLGVDIESADEGCPKCHGEVTQRVDDTPDGVRKRLDTFYAVTMPVIEYYRKNGLLIEVDGNKNVEEVFSEIIEKF